MDLGKDVPDTQLREIIESQKPNQCCTLIYTSGTTGQPKGVMLSHDNVSIFLYKWPFCDLRWVLREGGDQLKNMPGVKITGSQTFVSCVFCVVPARKSCHAILMWVLVTVDVDGGGGRAFHNADGC